MQEAVLEGILYQTKVSGRGSRRPIDVYMEGTVVLFTPPPPEPFKPIMGPWGPSESAQKERYENKMRELSSPEPITPLGFSVNPRSTKFFGEECKTPLLRIDRNANHGLPENHLQFGKDTYLGRHGNEAYEILTDVFRKSKREILFPFDEKKKPWER